ncbi:MAG: SPASM domain-containing protein [Deltaproteobacteria bacterium]|nr:SPASM domain-containing protein [Deltaproteobacteria bacterium]MBI3293778.1 SPASM domain-containing protein [Deltaproteobacteria bacterium]
MQNLTSLLTANARLNFPIAIYFSLKPTGHSFSEMTSHPDFRSIERNYGEGLVRAAKLATPRVDDWNGAVRLPQHLELKPRLPRAFVPCRRLKEGLRVYSNGAVGACACRDFEGNSDLILGQTSDGLESLWAGEKLETLRSHWRHLNKVPTPCQSCRDYHY